FRKGGMSAAGEVQNRLPQWQSAAADRRSAVGVRIAPSHIRSHAHVARRTKLAGRQVHCRRNAAGMKIVDDIVDADRHAKSRIGRFETAVLISASQYPDGGECAVAQI